MISRDTSGGIIISPRFKLIISLFFILLVTSTGKGNFISLLLYFILSVLICLLFKPALALFLKRVFIVFLFPKGFREVLHEISFIVSEGEKVSLIGPNGAGKSNLLLNIAGLQESKHRKGQIKICGMELNDKNIYGIREKIGFVFQDPNDQLFPTSVFDDVAFGNVAQYYGGLDDVAGQYGMIIAPEIFEKYFLPAYKKLISNIKKCGIILSWHCCGSVHKVIPMMIEAGIDVFDVVQTSAKDMEIENVYRLYGKDVCLHGGVDVQNLLVFKTSKKIREEVKKN